MPLVNRNGKTQQKCVFGGKAFVRPAPVVVVSLCLGGPLLVLSLGPRRTRSEGGEGVLFAPLFWRKSGSERDSLFPAHRMSAGQPIDLLSLSEEGAPPGPFESTEESKENNDISEGGVGGASASLEVVGDFPAPDRLDGAQEQNTANAASAEASALDLTGEQPASSFSSLGRLRFSPAAPAPEKKPVIDLGPVIVLPRVPNFGPPAGRARPDEEDPLMVNVPRILVKNFPFPSAYAPQLDYMQCVVRSLALGGASALLESPTGTGKTICLLVACASWLAALEDAIVRSKLSVLVRCRETELVEQLKTLAPMLRSGTNPALDEQASQIGLALHRCSCLQRVLESPPRVYYSSRTHSQLQQVLRELKKRLKPAYPQIRTSVLGSRAQMCVNSDVVPRDKSRGAAAASSNLSHLQVNALCQAKIASKSCDFHLNGSSGGFGIPRRVAAVVPETWDIEDLRSLGEEHSFCPFYFSRDLAKLPAEYPGARGQPGDEAGEEPSSGKKASDDGSGGAPHFVFVPYNYLCDRNIRNNMKIETRNQILIFDEAHNVDSVCCDSASFELSHKDIQDALRDTRTVERLIDAGSGGSGGDTLKMLAGKMRQVCEQLRDALTQALPPPTVKNGNESEPTTRACTFNPAWLLRTLEDGGLSIVFACYRRFFPSFPPFR
jgi:DEAD_2